MAAVDPAWKRLLLSSLARQNNPKTATFVQLATVRPDGSPANRTVVFRCFVGSTSSLLFFTDTRSAKVQELSMSPLAELCWYFPDTWEQFRIQGQTQIVGTQHPSEELSELRRQSWEALSSKQRKTWQGPQPGNPKAVIGSTEEPTAGERGPAAAAESAAASLADCFCLLLLSPRKVDYLSIKEDKRSVHVLNYSDLSCHAPKFQEPEGWTVEDVYP